MAKKKTQIEEKCPKCGCPELHTFGRQTAEGFRVYETCGACAHIIEPSVTASPVPAAEHQGLRNVAVDEMVHYDTASHQRYRGAEPAVRFVEPHREAFIALYEAANAVSSALGEYTEAEGWTTKLSQAEDALKGALDKAAPAYGQALVARAEGREPVAHQLSDRSPIGRAMLLGQGPVITFPAEKARVLTAARKYLEHWEDCEAVPDPEALPFELELYNAASALRAAETDEQIAKETGGQ